MTTADFFPTTILGFGVRLSNPVLGNGSYPPLPKERTTRITLLPLFCMLQFTADDELDLTYSIVMLYAGQFTVECQCYHAGKQIFDIDTGITLMVT